VAEKLGLVRQGKKSAFAAMAVDGRAMRAAVDGVFGFAAGASATELVLAKTGRIVSAKHAASIVRRGCRLLGLKLR
jgi:hypothetical protein